MIFTNSTYIVCMLRHAHCVSGCPRIDIMWMLAKALALHNVGPRALHVVAFKGVWDRTRNGVDGDQ